MLTPKQAVARGSLVVNGPVILIILAGCFVAGWFFRRSVNHENVAEAVVAFLIAFVAIALAWLYWSLAVPRWREWAIKSGADPEETQRLAVKAGITWPKGWIFEKTELPPRRLRAQPPSEGD